MLPLQIDNLSQTAKEALVCLNNCKGILHKNSQHTFLLEEVHRKPFLGPFSNPNSIIIREASPINLNFPCNLYENRFEMKPFNAFFENPPYSIGFSQIQEDILQKKYGRNSLKKENNLLKKDMAFERNDEKIEIKTAKKEKRQIEEKINNDQQVLHKSTLEKMMGLNEKLKQENEDLHKKLNDSQNLQNLIGKILPKEDNKSSIIQKPINKTNIEKQVKHKTDDNSKEHIEKKEIQQKSAISSSNHRKGKSNEHLPHKKPEPLPKVSNSCNTSPTKLNPHSNDKQKQCQNSIFSKKPKEIAKKEISKKLIKNEEEIKNSTINNHSIKNKNNELDDSNFEEEEKCYGTVPEDKSLSPDKIINTSFLNNSSIKANSNDKSHMSLNNTADTITLKKNEKKDNINDHFDNNKSLYNQYNTNTMNSQENNKDERSFSFSKKNLNNIEELQNIYQKSNSVPQVFPQENRNTSSFIKKTQKKSKKQNFIENNKNLNQSKKIPKNTAKFKNTNKITSHKLGVDLLLNRVRKPYENEISDEISKKTTKNNHIYLDSNPYFSSAFINNNSAQMNENTKQVNNSLNKSSNSPIRTKKIQKTIDSFVEKTIRKGENNSEINQNTQKNKDFLKSFETRDKLWLEERMKKISDNKVLKKALEAKKKKINTKTQRIHRKDKKNANDLDKTLRKTEKPAYFSEKIFEELRYKSPEKQKNSGNSVNTMKLFNILNKYLHIISCPLS